jgi:hypothetical protein
LARVDDLIWLDDSLKWLPSWFGKLQYRQISGPPQRSIIVVAKAWPGSILIRPASPRGARAPNARMLPSHLGGARWRLTFMPIGRGPDP